MKNTATKILILLLLISNSFLAYKVLNPDTQTPEIDDGDTIIREVVTEYTTDVTKVVADSIEKVVGVSSLYSGEVFSTGSGAIYKVSDGKVLIITNSHVIDEAETIKITFANGEQVDATLIGNDTFTDLALLEATVDFTVIPFSVGDSSLIKVGENVLAIGSPLGLEFQGSVTMGIISGKDRVVPVDIDGNGIDDWDSIVLQTDAAINPGNSGGPLINMAGELVGITSMKIADSTVEGMGFAIPVNEIVPILDQLQANGKVIRPLIGISAVGLDELTTYQKSFYGIRLDLENGLFVVSVSTSSAAEKAGLKSGDIITAFDGVEIKSFKEFRKLLYSKAVGDTVEVTYERNSKTATVSVTLQ